MLVPWRQCNKIQSNNKSEIMLDLSIFNLVFFRQRLLSSLCEIVEFKSSERRKIRIITSIKRKELAETPEKKKCWKPAGISIGWIHVPVGRNSRYLPLERDSVQTDEKSKRERKMTWAAGWEFDLGSMKSSLVESAPSTFISFFLKYSRNDRVQILYSVNRVSCLPFWFFSFSR